MIVGKYPFEGSNVFTLFENISSGSYAIPEWLDETLSNLLKKVLTANPDERLTIPQIRKHSYFLEKRL